MWTRNLCGPAACRTRLWSPDPVHHIGGCIRTECCISHISRLLDDKRDREGVRCVVHSSQQPDGLTLHIAALSARKLRSSSIHA